MSRNPVVESGAQKVTSPGRRPSPEGVGEPNIARSRRVPWLAIALVVGFLLNVAWRLWLVRDIQVPAAHADEDGYLLAARALAGGPGGYSTENAAFRRVGYPFLLAPIYWFTSDPFQVYRGAQLVNALINSLTFPLAYLFARRVFGQPRGWSLGLGVLVASMPAVVFYSQYAMIDAVLATFALVWLLLLHTWLTTTTTRVRVLAALGASAAAGGIYVLHVRGTMVVAVHLLVIIAFAVLRRTSWRLTLAAVVTAALAVPADKVMQRVLANDIITLGRDPQGQMVAALTTVHGAANATARAFGQLWYLAIGTWGLGAIGLVALGMAVWPLRDLRGRLRERVDGGRLLVLLTALVATLLIAGASSASLPTNDHRINYHAYPRYIHFLFPVWLMAGVVAIRLVDGRRLRMLAASAAGVTLLSAGVVYLRLQFNKDWIFLPFDSPEVSFLSWEWSAIRVVAPTTAGLVLLGLLAFTLSGSRSRTVAAAMAGVVVLHAAVMIASVEKITKPMTVDQYRGTPLLVRDVHVGPGDVVAISSKTDWYLPWNVMREVYWDRITMYDSQEPPAGANVVIAPYRYAKGRQVGWNGEPTFHRLAVDDHHHWAVWRRN